MEIVIGHIENIKNDFHLSSFYNYSFFSNAAPLAVTFFFVLSGFLIAYLLMHEQQKTEKGKINIFKFYRNRILRIWPLYYLLVLMIFLIFPYIPLLQYNGFNNNFLSNNTNSFLLYLSFFPNFSDHQYGNILYIGQTWSLGVEEFFYIFFPLGLYFLPANNKLIFFILLIAASITITAVSKFWCNVDDPNLSLTCIYISRYRIYAFALGALSAYAYMNSKDAIFLLVSKQKLKVLGNILFCIIIVLLISGTTFSSLTHLLYSVMFAILLFLMTLTDIKVRLLNHPYIIYLGKISYGIYMFHPIVIVIALKLFYIDTGNAVLNVLLLDSIIIALLIVLSIASYNFFEKFFLTLRK